MESAVSLEHRLFQAEDMKFPSESICPSERSRPLRGGLRAEGEVALLAEKRSGSKGQAVRCGAERVTSTEGTSTKPSSRYRHVAGEPDLSTSRCIFQ